MAAKGVEFDTAIAIYMYVLDKTLENLGEKVKSFLTDSCTFDLCHKDH